jgi:hypothetical protein
MGPPVLSVCLKPWSHLSCLSVRKHEATCPVCLSLYSNLASHQSAICQAEYCSFYLIVDKHIHSLLSHSKTLLLEISLKPSTRAMVMGCWSTRQITYRILFAHTLQYSTCYRTNQIHVKWKRKYLNVANWIIN